jgi:phage/plasmid-associated DNA primase
MNPMARFISDICVVEDDGFTTGDDLYRVYTLWAKQHDINHPLSQTKVVRELNSSPLGIVQARNRVAGKQVRGFKGLKLAKFDPI